jgi:protein pelota
MDDSDKGGWLTCNCHSSRVQNVTETGSTSSQRVRTQLTIQVEKTVFDAQECVLNVNGRTVAENAYVKVSMFTISLSF